MMMEAVLTSRTHPEYGELTIPFPIPEEDYDRMIELLEELGIGDVFAQDASSSWKASTLSWSG